MKKLLFVTGMLVILLFSCGEPKFEPVPVPGSSTRRFWAQDTTKDYSDSSRFYQLTAALLAENDYCKVWAETTSGVSKETAREVADAYLDIYSKMIDAFGLYFQISGKIYNTIQLADNIGDRDGKLRILLLDIKDSYQKGVNESAVGGYFYSGDLFDQKYSNLCDMIYIDTSPGKPGENESNMTLAHELQHLMNEVTSLAIRNDGKYYYPLDLWINEGLSVSAEWVYSGGHPVSRWVWYHLNGDGKNIKSLIDKGNNFFVWGNRTDENPYAILDDYATVYLFFQWLRIQNDGVGIYRNIIGSERDDYLAVTGAASTINPVYTNWGSLLGDWLAANYINNATGGYGYKNDPELGKLTRHFLPTNEITIDLYPGEGVYSAIDEDYAAANDMPSSPGTNISYYVLTTSPESTMAQGTLLTYNANPNNFIVEDNVYKEPLPETGIVTGIVNKSVVVPVEGRSVTTTPRIAGPYWIGAEDVRRSGRAGSLSPAGVPRLPNSIAVSE